jgi:hypothetical protein
MSLGGMVALRRLCEPHGFVCASVECTTGWLSGLYFPETWNAPASVARWPVKHDREATARWDASMHLAGMRPVPLLALHSEADAVVAWEVQRQFLAWVREEYERKGASGALVEAVTWESTGAPGEHAGFGRVAAEANGVQVEWLGRWFGK